MGESAIRSERTCRFDISASPDPSSTSSPPPALPVSFSFFKNPHSTTIDSPLRPSPSAPEILARGVKQLRKDVRLPACVCVCAWQGAYLSICANKCHRKQMCFHSQVKCVCVRKGTTGRLYCKRIFSFPHFLRSSQHTFFLSISLTHTHTLSPFPCGLFNQVITVAVNRACLDTGAPLQRHLSPRRQQLPARLEGSWRLLSACVRSCVFASVSLFVTRMYLRQHTGLFCAHTCLGSKDSSVRLPETLSIFISGNKGSLGDVILSELMLTQATISFIFNYKYSTTPARLWAVCDQRAAGGQLPFFFFIACRASRSHKATTYEQHIKKALLNILLIFLAIQRVFFQCSSN